MNVKNCSKSIHLFPFQLKKKSFLKGIIVVILLAANITSFGQEKSNNIEDALLSDNEYFHNLQLEKFFLHTNKTSYFPGEKIWFKAYIVNDTDNLPSLNTSNLHINLYDSKKKLVSSNLFLVNEGKATGEIELAKEILSGKYYLEVATQWNQNFDNNSSITSIDIISSNQNKEQNVVNQKVVNTLLSDGIANSLDIRFFPQSDVFLENSKNKIAFRISRNYIPISISGDIVDDKTGIIIAKLKSNMYGMGSCDIFLRPERTYTASIDFNGSNQKFAIPKAQSKGFIIIKNEKQSIETSHNFVLKTNNTTLKSNKNKNLVAVLHRNGIANVVVLIKLKKGVLNYSFNLKKEDFYNGINTITIFNNANSPISDYSFFYKNQKDIQLEISKAEEDKDSITLNFNLKNEFSKVNLSASILPEETRVYENNSSILSEFLIAPYLDAAPLNLSKIISSSNHENVLDLLIATRIKKNSFPYKEGNKIIPAENGLIIKGNVRANVRDITGYKVMLSSTESDILLIEPIGESNSFSFNNLILKHPSKYKLALVDAKGKIIKTGFKISNELVSYKANPTLLKTTEILQQENSADAKKTNIEQEENTINTKKKYISLLPLLSDDVTQLDEVKLSSSHKKENKLKKLGIKSEILNNGFSNLYVIEEDQALVNVFDYLYRIPGIKVFGDNPAKEFTIRTTRGPQSILGGTNMSVFVDGFLSDTEYLASRYISDFIAINVNSSGSGLGITGMGGVINFYTKKGKFSEYRNSKNEDIVVSETDFGFSSSDNIYENELFQYKNKDSRKFYGTVGWFPNIDILPNSIYKLKLDKNGFKDLKVIVNGINDEGKLVHKIVTINSDML